MRKTKNVRLGIVLRSWRHRFDVTLQELAKEIRMNYAALSLLETGRRSVGGETLTRILVWLMSEEKLPWRRVGPRGKEFDR